MIFYIKFTTSKSKSYLTLFCIYQNASSKKKKRGKLKNK